MTVVAATPSQTVGPFFSIGMAWMDAGTLLPPGVEDGIVLGGRVLDGAGEPVPDAVVEIWQADAHGRFPPDTGPGWTGFGRCCTDEAGCFRFVTVKPGPVDDHHAPHIDVSLFARGLLQRLVTRVYFPDEAAANAADPVLRSIADPAARATLLAAPAPGGLGFDIRLQGAGETVFFAY